MSGIILSPTLPSTAVRVSDETHALGHTLTTRVNGIKITDERSFASANELFKEIHDFDRGLEANRVEVKAPYLAVCKSIDESAKKVADLLKEVKARLGGVIKSYQDAENAKREAARPAALKEAQRLEDEAHERAEAERAAQIAAAADLPPDERPPEPPVFTAPIVAPVQPVYTPPALKSAVRTRPVYTLIIDDAAIIPHELAGITLMVPDESAIIELMKRGAKVPGCRLIEGTATAATGRW